MYSLELEPRGIPLPLEKIHMAHLFIAYCLLGGGTMLAIISFCLELCLGKSKKWSLV